MASMLVVERAVALLLIATCVMVQLSNAAVYKVGDSAGWTTIGNVDYKSWAATKTFKVGDVIRFEYNAQFHNVMRVTHAMFRACNASAPLATYTTGNDSITITNRGHHYFFCGVPGHCQIGQKVDINVLRPNATTTTALAPTPSSLPSPSSVHSAEVPGPSSNDAVLFRAGKGRLIGKLELVMAAVFAVFIA